MDSICLRQYREAHIPFAEAFNKKYGVGLDVVLLVVAALCQRVFTIWTETEGKSIFRFWQRAYEGPYTRKYVIDEIQAFLPLAQKLLGIRKKHIDQKELHKAIHFWELDEIKRQGMDLAYLDLIVSFFHMVMTVFLLTMLGLYGGFITFL